MDTGKAEYAPDYKSQFEMAIDEGRRIAESVIANNKTSAEYQRLQSAVISSARQWKTLYGQITTAFTNGTMSDAELVAIKRLHVDAEIGLMDATDRLIAFEEQNGIGET